MESLSVQALQEGGLWEQKGKNAVQLSIHFHCEDMEGTGGAHVAGGFTRRGVETAHGFPASVSLPLGKVGVSCFIEGTHKKVVCSLDLGELISLDDEHSKRLKWGGDQ